MELSQFSEKLNKVDGKVYVIEEKIQMPESGVYEALLQHDNINEVTLTVYTGPQLTGEQLQSYALSTPSLTPWKRSIRIQASAPVVYICYETDGDTVEADDVNGLQSEVVRTQQSVTDETDRAQTAESALGEAVQKEAERASAAEQSLAEGIQEEAQRAQQAETQIRQEIDQNRPNWDEAYSKRHTHNNGSILEKLTQAMLDKLAGIAEGANKYIHPVTPGNKHIPAGGKAGQILKWHADGEAEWASDSGDTHPDSGVKAGTYRSVTVNAQGHVTGGSNPTTLAGYGITDAAAKSHSHDGVYLKKGSMTWADLGGGSS